MCAFVLLPAQIEVVFPLLSGICATRRLQLLHFISRFNPAQHGAVDGSDRNATVKKHLPS